MGDEQKTQMDERLSLKFAELAKREKALRDLEMQVKQQKEEVNAMFGEVNKYKEREALKETNPLKWLEENNMRYDKLTDALAQSEEYKDGIVMKDLRDQINSLKEMMTSLATEYKNDKDSQKKMVEEAQKTNEQYARKQWLETLKKKAEVDPEKFEVTNAYWDEELAFEIQSQYYEKTGKLLDEDTLLENLENTLASRVKEEYSRLKGFKKIMGGEPEELPLSEFEQANETEYPDWMKPKKTLSKNMPPASSTTSDQNSYLSREDSIQAIAAKYSNR